MRVLVSGGGTGGHIYPAISLVNHLKISDANAEFLYVGTEKGLESTIVPEYDIPFKTIEIQGFRRSLSVANFKTAYLFMKSIGDSKKLLKEFKPDVVIGTGGYVCGAVVYAAHKLGIPTIIHEQNSVPGITNKFLAKYVDKIAICFPDAAQYFPQEKVVLTGNPRAQEVVNIEKTAVLESYGLKQGKPTVLVFGGSQGALTLTNAMKESLVELAKRDYQIVYGTGQRYYEDIQRFLIEQQIEAENIAILPYIDNMAMLLKNIDLVVSRAGATSLAEITALGLPSILIPSPNVTNDHQTKNAQSLVKSGATSLLKDSELTSLSLVRELDNLMLNSDKLEQMALSAKGEGIPDASDRLEAVIDNLTK